MEAIGAKLIEVGWRASDDQSQVVRLAADFADTDEWALGGYSTPGRWIAEKLDIARRTANEWIRVGRCLRVLPATSVALDERQISFSKAKELTRSATPENETELLAIAATTPASRLGIEIASWLSRHEPDEVIDAHQHDARSLRWHTEPDGTVSVMARLPPAQAGVLTSLVDAEVMRHSRVPRDPDVWPSLARQRADGLIGLLVSGGAEVITEVVLHVRGDGATLDDGTPITHTAVAKVLDDSLVRALVHDAKGRPINASSRQRHPTTRQKRVVKERDRVCLDCGSSDLLEYDHVPDFAETGRTMVEELELRCGPCHRFRHEQAS